ncbi:MAG: PAS domain S-box protein [Terriglobia bacterium]
MKQGLNRAGSEPSLIEGGVSAPEQPISLLVLTRDSHLAERCAATLSASGFSPAIDGVASPTGFKDALASKSYDLALAETAPEALTELADALQGMQPSIPLVLLTKHPGAVNGFGHAGKRVLDYLSPEELYRLPRLARQTLEMKALNGQARTAREAQQASEERYRALFERNVAGVFRASLDGRLLDVNETCAGIFGYASREEARQHTLEEILTGSEYCRLKELLQKQNFVSNIDLQLRRHDGQSMSVLANASILKNDTQAPVIEGTLADVTEWKRAVEALQQSENRFRAMVEKSSDAISLVDAQGKVLYSSHAVSPIFGYSLEERKGKNIFELVHAEDIGETLAIFKKLLQNPFTSVSTPVRYRHKDGTWRWIEALGTNLLEEPSVRAVVINYRDITERRQLMEQLFQAQKMEAVGRLAGGVAHDFNNLLTAILGYSDMALEKLPRNSLLRRYISEVKKAGERAASLTRQLLAFSRLQVMSPQVLDLNTVILDMEKILRRVIGEDIILTTVPGAVPCRIKADPSQIEQVILNLAINARDAMLHGGSLKLKASSVTVEEGFTSEGVRVQPGAYALLEITDTGCGMDPETRSRAFEPFFTTKEKGKGTGLGLSTVYGIIKQSSGYIWLNSEPGRGAAFTIYLPRVDEAASPAKTFEAALLPHRGNETILLVEDEESVRELLRRALRSKGYRILEAKNGEEALAVCANWRQPIHLALTDVVMPQMNGRELARRIASLHPETKVLYMTGYAGNRIGSAEVLEEDAQFIQKPFSADAIADKIRTILDAGLPA